MAEKTEMNCLRCGSRIGSFHCDPCHDYESDPLKHLAVKVVESDCVEAVPHCGPLACLSCGVVLGKFHRPDCKGPIPDVEVFRVTESDCSGESTTTSAGPCARYCKYRLKSLDAEDLTGPPPGCDETPCCPECGLANDGDHVADCPRGPADTPFAKACAEAGIPSPGDTYDRIMAGQVTSDPWAHRSTGMTCRSCMWFVFDQYAGVGDGGHFDASRTRTSRTFGKCRRHAPVTGHKGRFPGVTPEMWCGDHKLDEGKV